MKSLSAVGLKHKLQIVALMWTVELSERGYQPSVFVMLVTMIRETGAGMLHIFFLLRPKLQRAVLKAQG